MDVHRGIFYDALPVKKPTESDADHAGRLKAKATFLDAIRSHPNFSVRDGLTRLKAGSGSAEVRSSLEQKGVDTWIAVDAIRYALMGLADEIHIYTSDSDIYPVFEALKETRCRGTLYYDARKAKEELIYAADSAYPIDYHMLSSWLQISTDLRKINTEFSPTQTIEIDSWSLEFGRAGQDYLMNVCLPNGRAYCLVAPSWVSFSHHMGAQGIKLGLSQLRQVFGDHP